MGVLGLLGKILFVVCLFSSAYNKIFTPESFKTEYNRGYAKVNNLATSHGLNFLPK